MVASPIFLLNYNQFLLEQRRQIREYLCFLAPNQLDLTYLLRFLRRTCGFQNWCGQVVLGPSPHFICHFFAKPFYILIKYWTSQIWFFFKFGQNLVWTLPHVYTSTSAPVWYLSNFEVGICILGHGGLYRCRENSLPFFYIRN